MILTVYQATKPDPALTGRNILTERVLERVDGAFQWLDTDMPMSVAAESEFIAHASSKAIAGLFVRNIETLADIEKCATLTAVGEAEGSLEDGRTGLIACIQSPSAILNAATLVQGHLRLNALVFDAGTISAALGVCESADVIRHARSTLLLAAAAACVPALTMTDASQAQDFRAACESARAEGFAGIVAKDNQQWEIAMNVFAGPACKNDSGNGSK